MFITFRFSSEAGPGGGAVLGSLTPLRMVQLAAGDRVLLVIDGLPVTVDLASARAGAAVHQSPQDDVARRSNRGTTSDVERLVKGRFRMEGFV